MCVVCVRRGRGGGVGGPRWRRSGGASAGLPPYLCKLHAPPVPRAHGCQQGWNVQRGRANGTVDARRPRLGMISLSLERSCLLSPTAAREAAETCQAVIAGSNRYSPASAACGIQSWLRLSAAIGLSLGCNLPFLRLIKSRLFPFAAFQGAILMLPDRRFLSKGPGWTCVNSGFSPFCGGLSAKNASFYQRRTAES